MTAAGPGVALPGRTVSPAGNGFQSAVLQPTVLLRTAAAVHGSAPASVLIPCPPSFCKLTYFANFRPNFALQYWLLADCRGLPCYSYHLHSGLQRPPPARTSPPPQREISTTCFLQLLSAAEFCCGDPVPTCSQPRPAAAPRRHSAATLQQHCRVSRTPPHTAHTAAHSPSY